MIRPTRHLGEYQETGANQPLGCKTTRADLKSGGKRAGVYAAIAIVAACTSAPAFAQYRQYRQFDVPSGDAGKSIPEFARQAQIQVVAPGDQLHGVITPPIKGPYDVFAALDLMLKGTGLVVSHSADGIVTISLPGQKKNEEREMSPSLKRSTSVLALLLSFLGGSAASAQTTVVPSDNSPGTSGSSASSATAAPVDNASGASEGKVETVVVTGSRVISDIANSPTPVTAVSSEQLLTTTPSNIEDALNKLPVFQNSSSSRNLTNAGSNGAGDFLNLRNFGQQRTLVLLDGMRLPASNANGSVDVSTLPEMLMSRVDVVTGGASSVYGSDAITGVVNFILDKNFNGVKYEANAGISQYGDGFKYKVSVAGGMDVFGGKGHIEGALEYRNADGVLQSARPIFANGYSSYNTGSTPNNPVTNVQHGGQTVSTFDGLITCSNCSVNGYEFGSPGIPTPANLGTIPAGQTAIGVGGDGATVDNESIYGDTRNAAAFGRFSYNIDKDTTFFTQLSVTQANEFGYFFPSQQEPSRQTVNYYKNNAFLPLATQQLLGDDSATDPNWATDGTNTFKVSEWYGAQNRSKNTNNVTRNIVSTTGVNGVLFNDFSWDAHYTHGETRLSTSGVNNGNNQFHDAAQDAVVQNGQVVCYNDTAAAIALYGNIYPGCVPINTFGNNVTTDQQFAYWSRTTHFAETNSMDDIAADISGDLFQLPAGPVKVALAAEMRWLGYSIESNASPTAVVNCSGLRLCGNAAGTGPVTQSTVTQTLWDNNTLPSVQASENVWEFSGEVGVPILKDLPLVQSLDADIAGRYTNYSVSGAAQTWKIGLDWHVNDTVRFRGTTSVDIRAPTLNDLYSPVVSASGPFLDPLTNFNPGGIQTLSSGNPNLVPEVSRTYTGGVVLTPSFIPGLTMSVDYYQIRLKNAITTISGSNPTIANICAQSGGTSPFCTLYVRPFPYTNTTPANYPTLLKSQSLNAAFNATEGEDYEIDYGFDTADVWSDLSGMVNLRALLNVAPVDTSSSFVGAPLSYVTSPKGHATIFADYSLGDWSVDAQWHWFSGGSNTATYGAGQTYYAQPYYTSFSTTDFTLTKRITFGDGTVMSAYFNVQNAFNSVPPYTVGSASNPGSIFGGIPAGEDVMGRYFTIGVRGNL
jgi:outer membrane receptor protein involved in Fe transport